MQQRCIQYRAANVIEVEIDAVGASTPDCRCQIVLRLVVDDRIEPQFIGEPGGLLCPTGDTNDATRLDAGDLRGYLTDPASRCRYQYPIAGRDSADVAHAKIGRHRTQPKRTNPRQRVPMRHATFWQFLRWRGRVRLPAKPCLDKFALL